ncbi:MFS transporter [Agriterribacter sp.]|uniref:MFS transporter n=1 Tax=Agriterribacter sp. TaxID=2821509 RepID=UPI002BA37C83|nr:MFS transporter [Agriterribacter sp.]HRP57830.1 MFS transporter [Agriterribacter sp.]
MLNMQMKNSKKYPWIVVALLWVVALLNYMDRQMLSTMQPSMQVDIAELQTAEAFGFLMAIFLYIYGFMSPVAGIIADRMNRKWLIVGSLFVWSAVTYAMGITTQYNHLLILRGVMGISEALYIPAGLSLIADYHSGKTRSLAIGIHMTGLYTGSALGGFGASVAAEYGWHSAFHWFGITGMVYALVLIAFLREKRDTPAAVINPSSHIPLFKGLGLLFSNMAFWVILFYFAAPSLPGWATKNWFPTLFADSLNMPMEVAGPLSTFILAASSFVGAVFIGGPLSDKWVQKNVRGRVMTSAIGLGLTIPSLILLGYGHTLVTVVGAGILFGVGFGMFDANNMPILCQFVPKKLRGTAYGFMNMVGVFAGAAVTQVLGSFKDQGNFGFGFAVLSAIVSVALIVQLSFLRPKANDFDELTK